jgi:DNA-directed RNA polymerase specialized sigma24 family protein
MEMTEPPAATEPPLPGQSWEDLLDFLDPERAGKRGAERDAEAQTRYLEMRSRLSCFFAGRGCRDAEDLAAECVLRVAAKCGSLDASARENQAAYFYGVARNVLHEWWRHELRDSGRRESLRLELARTGWADGQAWARKETVHRCLDECMGRLSHRARRLVLSYYAEEGAAKIACHQRLAAEVGKSLNALRIDVYRIRSTLRQCVAACVHQGGDAAALLRVNA